MDKILKILRSYTDPYAIHDLPATFRTAVGKYPDFQIENVDDEENLHHANTDEKNVKDVNNPQFIYFGIQKSVSFGVAKIDDVESYEGDALLLNINIDGAPSFSSSKKQIWPIFGSFFENDPFVIALYYGSSKPKNANNFLKHFVDEVWEINTTTGIEVKNQVYSIKLNCGIFDSPARSFTLGIPYFNSYEGCFRCHEEGVHIDHRMCFLGIDAPKKTMEDILNYYRETGKNDCELLRLDYDIPNMTILDVLHVIDLGVTKKIMKLITATLSPALLAFFSNLLSGLKKYAPREFQRKPRSLEEMAFFKGKEYRALLHYILPVIFENRILISKAHYNHLMSLHVAYRILSDEEMIKDQANLNYARDRLRNFVADFGTLYGEKYVSYNVHVLIHIVDDVERFGKIVTQLSAYKYKTFMRMVGKLVRSATYPAVQIARRIHEMSVFRVDFFNRGNLAYMVLIERTRISSQNCTLKNIISTVPLIVWQINFVE